MRPKHPAPHSGSPEAEITHHGAPLAIDDSFSAYSQALIRNICEAHNIPLDQVLGLVAAYRDQTPHHHRQDEDFLRLVRAFCESQSPEKTPERGGDAG